MAYRKLGRSADKRKAMLKGLVTALLQNGSIVTTETRAREVQSITEKIIAKAVREADNFTTRQVKVSSVPVDSKGKRQTTVVTSKNGRKYTKFTDREIKTELVRIDNPQRLAEGKNLNIVNKLFDEIAPKYKDRKGGYTRIYKTGPRRGDAAPMAILELV